MSSTVELAQGSQANCAIRLREAGHQVTLMSKGIGGLQLSQGSIDVLG